MSSSIDLKAAREQFPITREHVYFDTANMNSPPLSVTQALGSYFEKMQQHGGDKNAWLTELESTRRKAASLLSCDASELAFCKNTSEGLNIAANAIAWRRGDNVVIPAHEHPNNVFPWLNLRRHGVEVRMVPETKPWVDADMLRPFVDARTRIIAVADVAFHPGQRNDLQSISAMCAETGAHLVVDGVQAVGLLDVRLHDLGVSMWAASGHKGLLSPHGIGLFFCRKDLISEMIPVYAARASMTPGMTDDHVVEQTDVTLRSDARRFEIGNFNYSAVHGMSAALDFILGIGISNIERHVIGIAEYLTDKLAQRQIERWGPGDRRRRSTICVFDLPGSGWVDYFAKNGIIVSGRRGAIRASVGLHNTLADVDRFIAVLDGRADR